MAFRTLSGMRRLARGGTTRPGLSRPGNGYGRPLTPGPSRLTPLRLETSAMERVVAMWSVDLDLAAAESQDSQAQQ